MPPDPAVLGQICQQLQPLLSPLISGLGETSGTKVALGPKEGLLGSMLRLGIWVPSSTSLLPSQWDQKKEFFFEQRHHSEVAALEVMVAAQHRYGQGGDQGPSLPV